MSAVTEDINRNVVNIHDATDDINRAAEEAADSGRELRVVAEEMNSVVTQFQRG